jgi:hypothetical protein
MRPMSGGVCGALVGRGALLVARDGSAPATQVLTLRVVTAPGLIEFDTQKPGVYPYRCSAGGHWRTQHGTLVVR